MTEVDKALDEEPAASRLRKWLRAEVGLVDQIDISLVTGGWSNITSLAVDAAGRRVVLRRPPAGHIGGGAHDVLREAAIMGAVHGTGVPVPAVLGRCADQALIGVPFYVTDFIPGTVVRDARVAGEVALAQRRPLGMALVDVLADLQAVELDAVGLGELRRSTPYLQRQLRRFDGQWRADATREVPAVERAAELLVVAMADVDPGHEVLVHGDLRFGNVMIDGVESPRITALLDWELTSSGHRLADLGALGARMQAPPGVLEAGVDPSAVEGFPTLPELAAHFEQRTGTSTADLPVFIAFSAWRWAVIVQGIARRLSSGVMTGGMGGGDGESAAWHRRRVELLGEFAADLLS